MAFQILIILLLVRSIHYTMQPNEIFGGLGKWFDRKLPDAIKPPVFGCPVCMTPYYGSGIYWLLPWEHSLIWWPVVVISAMGLQAIVQMFKPK